MLKSWNIPCLIKLVCESWDIEYKTLHRNVINLNKKQKTFSLFTNVSFLYYLCIYVLVIICVTPALVLSVVLGVLCLSFVWFCWPWSCLSADFTISVELLLWSFIIWKWKRIVYIFLSLDATLVFKQSTQIFIAPKTHHFNAKCIRLRQV